MTAGVGGKTVPTGCRTKEWDMAGLMGKLAAFARTPQGQQAIRKAQQAASDPRNRTKINQLVAKVQRRGGAR